MVTLSKEPGQAPGAGQSWKLRSLEQWRVPVASRGRFRALITVGWHNFGKVDCCQDATQGCNCWNYLNIYSGGGVLDILKALGNLPSKSAGGQDRSWPVRRRGWRS